jgi:curved DNA-binding protein CbpA
MADPTDPYKILQVDSEAEDEVIQAAYRRLARKYHPDLAEATDAAARMASINAAWELIGDPAKRAAFDRSRVMARTMGGGAVKESPVAPQTPPAGERPDPGLRRVYRRPAADAAGPGASGAGATGQTRPPETVSGDWTTGRSNQGGGFDESMRAPDGLGAAGPPPGRASGSVLNFGRYAGWSLGEIARTDIEYIEWLDRTPIGRTYREEVDHLLRAGGRRKTADKEAEARRGLYRRR